MAGNWFNGSDSDFALARYNIDGSLDTAFGAGGKTSFGVGGSDVARSIALYPGGRYIAAGTSGNQFATARILGATAPNLTITGRALTASGRGVPNARLTLTDSNGTLRFTTTNMFGYYRFLDIPAGATYAVSVSAKRHNFPQPSISVTPYDNVINLDFQAMQ